MSGLMITGTDTGVGKTFVAAGLARVWRDSGHDIGVIKPAETGHDAATAGPWPSDGRTLAIAARVTDPIDVVVPYVFREPLAPLVAARREGRPVLPERLADAYARVEARHEHVIVEGAGGLSVPIAEFGANDRLFDHADLAKLLGTPVLIVARAHLGTLNHTFLTVRYARERGLAVVGVVMNGLDARLGDPSVIDNAAMVEEMCQVPVLGTVDRIDGPIDVDVMAGACRSSIDVDRIFAAFRPASGIETNPTGELS